MSDMGTAWSRSVSFGLKGCIIVLIVRVLVQVWRISISHRHA